MKKSIYNPPQEKPDDSSAPNPPLEITQRMIDEKEKIRLTARHFACNELHAYGLYDPRLKKYTPCCSLFSDSLQLPVLPETDENNMKRINELTHPDDLKHIAAFEPILYHFLMHHRFKNPKDFRLVFVRRLLGSDSRYMAFVHTVTISVCYDNGIVWNLLVSTERNRQLDAEADKFYKMYNVFPFDCFSSPNPDCPCLQQVLTHDQFEIALMFCSGMTKSEIITKRFTSKCTYETHCDNIRERVYINDMNKLKIFFREPDKELEKEIESRILERYPHLEMH